MSPVVLLIPWWSALAGAADLELRVREKEDGDPVVGAQVQVVPDGPSTTTDGQGRARLDVAGEGPWVVEIRAEGRSTTTVESSEAGLVRVWMPAGDGVLEIVVEGLRPTADPTRHVVDGEQALETPGTLDDAVRLVQSLPGMTVQREYSPTTGDLAVRGARPGDSLRRQRLP